MKKQESKGITLIALVITIIVMLILVAVTINVATDGGLIRKAQEANTRTQIAADDETRLNNEMSYKIDEIVNGETKKYEDTIEGLPTGEESVAYDDLPEDLKDAADKGKIVAVIKEGESLAPIPNGFTISEVDVEQKISTGLVVKDKSGNEFVWVPVPDITKMARLQSENATDYEGILYDFSGITSKEKTDYGVTTTNFREPVVLNETKITREDENDITQEKMQSTFNSMVESVSKYGGFYVGRYETTKLKNDKVTVKAGETEDVSRQTWYRAYGKSKTLTTNCVQSELIWGCQYDAMLNWILTGTQASKVTDTTIRNSDGYHTTGAKDTDIINNIYDLAGNMEEWTQEAVYEDCRVLKGGSWEIGAAIDFNFASPVNTYTNNGSRITLYIK